MPRMAHGAGARRVRQGDDRHLGILQCRPRQDLHRDFQAATAPKSASRSSSTPIVPDLFPLVADIVGWTFPTTTCCICSTRRAKRWSNSARWKTASTRRRRRASACCSCRMPPRRRSAARSRRKQLAGNWAIMRGRHAALRRHAGVHGARRRHGTDGEAGLRRRRSRGLNFTQWRLDRDELMLVPARGAPWRFEEIEGASWRRVPGRRRARSCWCGSKPG